MAVPYRGLERAQQLAETVLPFLSGLLSPTASVYLEVRWSAMPSALALISCT